MKITESEIESIRCGSGVTGDGSRQAIRDVAALIASKIESRYSSDDLIDADPVAIALNSIVSELRDIDFQSPDSSQP